MLTVEADNAIGNEEHKKHYDKPTNDLGHPTTVMQLVARILLILDPNHYNSQDRKEHEIPQANAEHSVGLEPLSIRRLVEVINPFKQANNRSNL